MDCHQAMVVAEHHIGALLVADHQIGALVVAGHIWALLVVDCHQAMLVADHHIRALLVVDGHQAMTKSQRSCILLQYLSKVAQPVTTVKLRVKVHQPEKSE